MRDFLTVECRKLFKQEIDFDPNPTEPLTKAYMNNTLYVHNTEGYFNGLMSLCIDNAYCRSERLTDLNFGEYIEESPCWPQDIAALVRVALNQGSCVERDLYHWINTQPALLLQRPLNNADFTVIQDTFMQNFKTIAAGFHFDEFLLFDKKTPGVCFNHRGSICIDFALLARKYSAEEVDNAFFEKVRQRSEELNAYSCILLPRNDCVADALRIGLSPLLAVPVEA
jgi:hypothetical protein